MTTTPTRGELIDQQGRDLLTDAMLAHGLSEDGAETLATMMVSASEKSNPWLSSNPMVSILGVLSVLIRTNQEIRLAAQRHLISQTQEHMAMAKDNATHVRELAQQEAQLQMAQSMVGIATATAGFLVAGQLGAAMRQETHSLTAKISSDMKMAQVMMAQTATSQGIYSVMDSVLDRQKAEKGEIDAQMAKWDAMQDSAQKQLDAAMQSADEAVNAVNEMMRTLGGPQRMNLGA